MLFFNFDKKITFNSIDWKIHKIFVNDWKMKIIIIVDINENCNVKRVIALNINDFFVTKRVNKNRFVNIF